MFGRKNIFFEQSLNINLRKIFIINNIYHNVEKKYSSKNQNFSYNKKVLENKNEILNNNLNSTIKETNNIVLKNTNYDMAIEKSSIEFEERLIIQIKKALDEYKNKKNELNKSFDFIVKNYQLINYPRNKDIIRLFLQIILFEIEYLSIKHDTREIDELKKIEKILNDLINQNKNIIEMNDLIFYLKDSSIFKSYKSIFLPALFNQYKFILMKQLKKYSLIENINYLLENYENFYFIFSHTEDRLYLTSFINHLLLDIEKLTLSTDEQSEKNITIALEKLLTYEFLELFGICEDGANRYLNILITKLFSKILNENDLSNFKSDKLKFYKNPKRNMKKIEEIIIDYPFCLNRLIEFDILLKRENDIKEKFEFLEKNIYKLVNNLIRRNNNEIFIFNYFSSIGDLMDLKSKKKILYYVANYKNILKCQNLIFLFCRIPEKIRIFMLKDFLNFEIRDIEKLLNKNFCFWRRKKFPWTYRYFFLTSINYYRNIKCYLYQDDPELIKIFNLYNDNIKNVFDFDKVFLNKIQIKEIYFVRYLISAIENNITSKSLKHYYESNKENLRTHPKFQKEDDVNFFFHYYIFLSMTFEKDKKDYKELIEKNIFEICYQIVNNRKFSDFSNYRILNKILFKLLQQDVKFDKALSEILKILFSDYYSFMCNDYQFLFFYELTKLIYKDLFNQYEKVFNDILHNSGFKKETVIDFLKTRKIWWDKNTMRYSKYSVENITDYLKNNVCENPESNYIVDALYTVDYKIGENKYIDFIGPFQLIHDLDDNSNNLDNQRISNEYLTKKKWFKSKNFELIFIPYHHIINDINNLKKYCDGILLSKQ